MEVNLATVPRMGLSGQKKDRCFPTFPRWKQPKKMMTFELHTEINRRDFLRLQDAGLEAAASTSLVRPPRGPRRWNSQHTHLLPICLEPRIDVCCSHPDKKWMMAGRKREAGMKQQMLRVGILDLTN